MLNRGVYDGDEAAILIGVQPNQLIRWAAPDAAGLAPVVQPTFDRAFSFADLVSLRVAAQLRSRGVSGTELRRGLSQLRTRFDTDVPLTQKHILDRLATSGTSFLARLDDSANDSGISRLRSGQRNSADWSESWTDVGRHGQGVFEDVVLVYLKHIHFNDSGQPSTWRPARGIVLDPRVQAGAPCLEGTRIPTSSVINLLAVESEEDIAEDYGIRVADVRRAAAFENGLRAGHGMAA